MRICDRCGDNPCAEHLQAPVHRTEHDLCAECWKEFGAWVSGWPLARDDEGEKGRLEQEKAGKMEKRPRGRPRKA